MPSRTRTLSDYHEIASALTALYIVIDSLTLLGEDNQTFLPPYPEHIFSIEYVLEAGFSRRQSMSL